MITGRFAPSPTGRMHLGNIYCAVLSWLYTRKDGGRYVLRIEDLDKQRSKPHFVSLIEDDLHWIGLDWDEGGTLGGPNGPYFQSKRSDIYQYYFEKLSDEIYPCFCSRADLLSASAPHADNGSPIYAGTCRNLSISEIKALRTEKNPAWRITVPNIEITFNDIVKGRVSRNLSRDIGDQIIRRANGDFSYQFAVVVDDALMGINQVIRGEDLLTSAAFQHYLHSHLGFEPPRYGHIPLVCAPDGRRLCKRNRSLDMEALRAKYSPEEVLALVAHQASMLPREVSKISLLDLLSLAKNMT